jgi:hypothetical protein
MSKEEEAEVEVEWKTVTRADKKRVMRGRRRRKNNQERDDSLLAPWDMLMGKDDAQQERALSTLSDCIQQISTTDFFQNLWKEVEQCEIEQIVCLGVGNLSTRYCSVSMWQLACAVCLRQRISRRNSNATTLIPMLFYDPVTTAHEAELLSDHLDITVLSENLRGKHPTNSLCTLFFMPHCPFSLYRNLLLYNWNELDEGNVVIFGNALKEYTIFATKPPEKSSPNVQIIESLLDVMHERPMEASNNDIRNNVGDIEKAFNHSCLIRFEDNIKGEGWPTKPAVDFCLDVSDTAAFAKTSLEPVTYSANEQDNCRTTTTTT